MRMSLSCVYRGVSIYMLVPVAGPTLYSSAGRGIRATAIDLDMLKVIIDAALYTSVLTMRGTIHAIQ